jgi:hypothetical protein
MPRRIRIAVIALAVGLAVALGFFVDIVGRVRSLVETGKTEDDPFKLEPKPLFTPTDPAVAVKIFFPAASAAEPAVFQTAR